MGLNPGESLLKGNVQSNQAMTPDDRNSGQLLARVWVILHQAGCHQQVKPSKVEGGVQDSVM